MKRIEKLVSFLLAVAMLLAMVACTAPDVNSTPATEAAPAEAATPAAEAAPAAEEAKPEKVMIEPVEIEFWHALPESQGGTLITDICKEFSETNEYGITVKDVFCADFYAGIARDLQAAIAAGIYPGVTMIGYQYLNYFDQNFPQITSVSQLLEKYPEENAWVEENFTDRTLALTKSLKGNIVGLPYCASQAILYYNKDMFRTAGLDPENPPKTVDEMYDAAMAITKATGEYGIYLGYPLDTFVQETMLRSNGGSLYEMDGDKLKVTFNSPEGVEVWSKFQKFYTDKLSVPMTFEEGMSAFIAGKFGMTLNTCARINMISTNAAFDLGTTKFPSFSPDKELKSCVAGNMIAVIAENENKERAAWEFVKYLFSVENAAAIVMKTGYVPTVKDLESRSPELVESFKNNPYIQPALDSFGTSAISWTSWPGENGLQVSQVLIDMKDEIITSDVDVKTLLDKTAATIEGMLN